MQATYVTRLYVRTTETHCEVVATLRDGTETVLYRSQDLAAAKQYHRAENARLRHNGMRLD